MNLLLHHNYLLPYRHFFCHLHHLPILLPAHNLHLLTQTVLPGFFVVILLQHILLHLSSFLILPNRFHQLPHLLVHHYFFYFDIMPTKKQKIK